jgi:hypothetical protein
MFGMLRLRWILLPLALIGAYFFWTDRTHYQPPGVLVSGNPRQSSPGNVALPQQTGYRITPLARFDIEARVLGREIYRFDRGADLAPVDLALGWGPMSDTEVLKALTIRQGSRAYYWHGSELPIPSREISTHSANMHLIPATQEIEYRLKKARPGQIVALSGYLVEITGDDGWRWRSSLTREDTGTGACELIWVEQVGTR